MADIASDHLKVQEAAEAVQPGGPNHAIRLDRRELLRSERREGAE